MVLASRLAVIGYKVAIRTAVGGGVGQECFRNLNYEFLLVSAPFPSETSEIIVDPKFRYVVYLPHCSFWCHDSYHSSIFGL